MQLSSGSLVARRYRLVNCIGAGRLGELWRAAELVPTKQVAIRIVDPQAAAMDVRDAFVDEAKVVGTLRNPSLARILDAGVTDEGAPFVVTELLHGETLEELLERREKLSHGGALQLIAALADALSEAHRLGVVHLGLEPRAIFLHRSGDARITPKICDFGRARLLRPKRSPAREANEWDHDGVLAYRSPEQVADDPRTGSPSDVWALGVLLFRCVTGRLPFDGKTPMAHHTQALSAQRVVKFVREIEEPVRELILDCLRYTRGERVTAAVLADRARLLAWTTVGGWSDVEKMVRVPEDVSNPELFGVIDHFATIPGPAPASTRASAPPRKRVEPPRLPTSGAQYVALPISLATPIALPMPATPVPEPPREGETLRPMSFEVATTGQLVAPRPETQRARVSITSDLHALRPKVSRVAVAAVGSVVAFCIGAIVATAEPARAPRARIAGAAATVAREASKSAPRAQVAAAIERPAAGVVNALAKAPPPAPAPVDPKPAPKPLPQAAEVEKPAARTMKHAKAAQPVSEPAPTVIANLQGVPLWDGPKPAPKPEPQAAAKPAPKPVDDNPYE